MKVSSKEIVKLRAELNSNKKPIHKDMLHLMPIGVVNREYTCLYGNLNFYNLRNN